MNLLYNIRLHLQQRPRVAVGAMAGIIVLALVYAYWSTGPAPMPAHQATRKLFFMDETTGEIAVRVTDEPAPIANGERTLVQAVFYTPDHGKTRKLAYLQKYSDEAKAALRKIWRSPTAAADPRLQKALAEGTFIRSPEKDAPWIRLDSPEAGPLSARATRTRVGDAKWQIATPD